MTRVQSGPGCGWSPVWCRVQWVESSVLSEVEVGGVHSVVGGVQDVVGGAQDVVGGVQSEVGGVQGV